MRALAFVVLLGCGRVGFEARVASDGAPDDSAADAAQLVLPPGCTRYTFDAPPLVPPLISYGGGTVTLDGEMRCEIPGQPQTPCGIQTSPNRDFSGASVWFRLPKPTSRAATVNGQGWHAPSDYIHLFVRGSEVRFEDTNANTVRVMPYDPPMHQWLRVDDDGTRFIAMTSPDGIAWTTFDTLPRFDLTDVFLDLGSDSQMDGGPDFALYDDLVLCF